MATPRVCGPAGTATEMQTIPKCVGRALFPSTRLKVKVAKSERQNLKHASDSQPLPNKHKDASKNSVSQLGQVGILVCGKVSPDWCAIFDVLIQYPLVFLQLLD